VSQEDILKVLSDISMADSTSYWIVGALTVLVTVVMRAMLPVKSLALVFAPVIFWGGLCGIYAMREVGFVATAEKNANVIATATIGMVVALVLMILLVRFLEAVTRIRKPLASPAPLPPPRIRI
jgi:hypothetical protein